MTDESRMRTSVGELQDMIEQMISTLKEAKAVPLSSSVLIDRDNFLAMCDRLRAELPDELRAARWMVREREAFITRTNERAKDVLERAQAEGQRLVADSHILAEAVEEANVLTRRAEGEARRIRLEAEDDVLRNLDRLEGLLIEVSDRINRTRAELHTSRPPDQPL